MTPPKELCGVYGCVRAKGHGGSFCTTIPKLAEKLDMESVFSLDHAIAIAISRPAVAYLPWDQPKNSETM